MPALRSLKAARGATLNTSSTSAGRIGEDTWSSVFGTCCSLGSAAGTGRGGGDGTELEPLPLPAPGSGVEATGGCSPSAMSEDAGLSWAVVRQAAEMASRLEIKKCRLARMPGYPRWFESLCRNPGAYGNGRGAMLADPARAASRFCVSCVAARLISWSRVSVVSDSLVMLRDLGTQCCREGGVSACQEGQTERKMESTESMESMESMQSNGVVGPWPRALVNRRRAQSRAGSWFRSWSRRLRLRSKYDMNST